VNLFVIKKLGQAMMLHKDTNVEGSIHTHTHTHKYLYYYIHVQAG